MPQMPLGPVMLDVAGTELTHEERAALAHPRTGGVILFSRNFAARAQLAALVERIHALRDAPLLVAVDHEGGRIQRFTEGFTALPAMRALGQAWARDAQRALHAATATGFVLAAELREVGIDLSFAPVLDLDHGVSRVIGDRAFGRDARTVASLARALMHGMLLAGMKNCGKHFPGHGFAHGDSHFEAPVDERPLDAILAEDAAPYGWIGSPALAAVMPAHVVYPAVDAQPAGFSRVWLQDVLRRRLGFDGVIFSDDLCMAGACSAGEVEARARAALSAGCDMVLVCNDPVRARRVLDAPDLPIDPASSRRIASLLPQVARPDPVAIEAARRELRTLAALA